MIRKSKIGSGILAAILTLTMIPAGAVSAGETLSLTGGGQRAGETDGYSYELWQSDNGCGTSTMTLGDGATFSCQWDCSGSTGNFLARRGKRFDCTQTYKDIGNIAFDYDVDYNPGSQGSSYLCVYGWTREPLVEYYIVDNWKNWRPPNGDKAGQNAIATVEIDGALYDIYKHQQVNTYSIDGNNSTFWQYFSVRQEGRSSGVINIAKHFEAWEKEGLEMGKFYEAALNIEGYESTGTANVKKNVVTVGEIKETEPATEPEPDPDGYYFHSTYESGKDSWTSRGDASIGVTDKASAAGSQSLAVTGRTDSWHGTALSLSTSTFVPGTAYSFSVMAMQDKAASDDFKLTLQYDGSDGETHYDGIAEATGSKGEWVQLANMSFTIPAGAKNLLLYVETADSTTDFYIDEAIGAPKGTKITAEVKALTGDVDADGSVTVTDIIALQKFLLGVKVEINNETSDLNEDGVIDVFDLALLKRQLLNKASEPVVVDPVQDPTEVRVEGQWYNTADVSWIDPSKPMVALAFDDGPIANSECPERIQDAISNNGGHSTFFYWGERIAGNEDEIKRAQSLGMEIANHTWSHPDMTKLSADQMRTEITKCADALTSITGLTDFLIRPPYLNVNDTFKEVAGVPLINCSVYSMDWDGASKEQIINTITNAMNDGSLNGAIVLMHENYETTAGAIEYLAPYLKENGWQMVTVSEMFKANGKVMYNGQVYNRLS